MVFGGGRRGLMGAAADAALAAGGRVIGVIPASLQQREQSYAQTALTELHVVRSMHERKAMMAQMESVGSTIAFTKNGVEMVSTTRFKK